MILLLMTFVIKKIYTKKIEKSFKSIQIKSCQNKIISNSIQFRKKRNQSVTGNYQVIHFLVSINPWNNNRNNFRSPLSIT